MRSNTFFLLVILIGTGATLHTQTTQEPEFMTAFYFEDAIGNRDTIEVGYDPRIEAEYDYPAAEFGQVELTTPFDSIFEVRLEFTPDHYPRNTRNNWYKRMISPAWQPHPEYGCFRETASAVVAIQAKHQPVTVSWNPADFTSNYCHIGGFIAQHLWADRYEGNQGPFWWQGYPEYLDSMQCLALDSTWAATLRTDSYDFGVDEAYVPGRNGTVDTLYTMRIYLLQQQHVYSPCDVNFVSSTKKADYNQKAQRLSIVYPNPVHDYLYFEEREAHNYTIYDLLGRPLLEGYGTQIDVSSLQTGSYRVVVDQKEVAPVFKF